MVRILRGIAIPSIVIAKISALECWSFGALLRINPYNILYVAILVFVINVHYLPIKIYSGILYYFNVSQ